MGPFLPLDIVEMIMALVSTEEDDPEDLVSVRSCSLVCHAFLPICRKRIFASVNLNNKCSHERSSPRETTISTLHNQLSANPEIARYIRDLYFHLEPDDFNDPASIAAFEHITHLQSFKAFYYPLHREKKPEVSWDRSPLRSAVLHFFRLPSLTKLEIFGITNFILADLASCINLENWSFNNLTTLSTPPTNLSNSPISLRSLSTGSNSSSTVNQICIMKCADGRPFFDLSRLTKLDLSFGEAEHNEASRTLVTLCQSLINIEMTVFDADVDLATLPDMLHSSIQTLKLIQICIFYDEEKGDDPLCNLAAGIERIDKENIIEDIKIEVHISEYSDCDRGAKWGRLDKAFERATWPVLRRVSVIIWTDFQMREQSFIDEFDTVARVQFPWLWWNNTIGFELDLNDETVDESEILEIMAS